MLIVFFSDMKGIVHREFVPPNTTVNSDVLRCLRVNVQRKDLAPCDFALFPKLKMKLKGRHFETVSDIQGESQVVLDNIKQNYFHSAFEAWKK
jgi:hypothetical protein